MSNKSLPASPRGVGLARGQRSRFQLSRPNWRLRGGRWGSSGQRSPSSLATLTAAPSSPSRSVLAVPAGVPVCPLGPAGLRPGSQPTRAVHSHLRPQHVKATFPGLPEPGRQGTTSVTHCNYRAQGQATRNNREAWDGFPYHLSFMVFQTRTSIAYGETF